MAEKVPKAKKLRREIASEDTKDSKSKREKRRREETADEAGAEESPQLAEEPQKKKHKKNKTGFPNPGDDASLSEQASKALSYAFLQFRKPAKWKFSKARQNWLIRNIWSDQIPDTYLALTVQYLSNVKGGVRETLIKDCQSVLFASAPEKVSEKVFSAESVSQAQPAKIPQVVVEPDQLKQTRARALLDALETPKVIETVE
ncbi:hypothetical protein B0H19DRAFT_342248 [Mycena capillaripes]|nr:hypothetical protein B0H19DRAFT_342248 [Mycena capillaripes]